MLSTTTGTSCTCSSRSSVTPVLSGVSLRALRSFVWTAGPRIVQVLADVGGPATEARASVGADGNVVVMADWRGWPLTADALGDAAARIAVALGVAPEIVWVADAWCWTDNDIEAAWRGGMVLPMPADAPPVASADPTPGGGRRPRCRIDRLGHVPRSARRRTRRIT